jgi:hypothetical protein
MSDFLTNLAVRSAGSAEVIQPRLPALFEPPIFGSHGAPVFVPEGPREESLAETTRQTAAPGAVPSEHINGLAARARSPVPPPRAEYEADARPAPKLEVPEPVSPLGPPLSLAGEIVLNPAAAHTLPRFHAARFDSKTVLSSEAVMREAVVAAAPSRSRKEVGEAMRPPNDSARSYKAAGEPDVDKGLSGETLRSRGPATPRIEYPSPLSNLSPQLARSVIEPGVRPRSAVARRRTPSSQSSPSEPVVQVTIGRIEVRGTPQQPQAHRERSASPVMSLDEYLRSRAKRRSE